MNIHSFFNKRLFSVLGIFGIVFVVGIGIGRWTIKSRIVYVEKIKTVESEDTAESKIQRCGMIPENLYIPTGRFSVGSGPEWSSDCRFISWGIWASGTAWIGDGDIQLPRKINPMEGIYLYNDRTQKTIKVYSPKVLDELPVFDKWVDNTSFQFTAHTKKYIYDVYLGKVSDAEN